MSWLLLLISCFENFPGKSGKKKKKKSSSAEGDSDVVNTYSRISKAILNTPLRAIQRLQKKIDSCKINIPM